MALAFLARARSSTSPRSRACSAGEGRRKAPEEEAPAPRLAIQRAMMARVGARTGQAATRRTRAGGVDAQANQGER